MSDKTLFPICGTGIEDGCFNLELQQLVVGGVAARSEPYQRIETWGGAGFKVKFCENVDALECQ